VNITAVTTNRTWN